MIVSAAPSSGYRRSARAENQGEVESDMFADKRKARELDQLRAKADGARDRKAFGEAADAYRALLLASPDEEPIWVQLGNCEKDGGRHAEAEKAYLRALSLAPGNADTHLQLGHLRKLTGDLPAALAAYRRAFALDAGLEAARDEIARLTPPQPVAQAAAPAAPAGDVLARLEALERRSEAGGRQDATLRALGAEQQRLRQRVEALAEEMAASIARMEALLERAAASAETLDGRLSRVEHRHPEVETGIAGLYAQFRMFRAQDEEIARQRAQLDRLDRSLGAL